MTEERPNTPSDETPPVIDLDDAEFQDYEGDVFPDSVRFDLSSLWSQSALRGFAAIVLTLILIQAQSHSSRLLSIVIAVALIAWSAGGVIEMIRGAPRTPSSLAKVIVLAGFALTLLLWPRLSIDDMGQLVGVALIVAGVINLIRSYRGRNESPMIESVVGALLYMAIGIALAVSPTTFLHLTILAFAIYWFVAGILTVVTSVRHDEEVLLSQTWRKFLEWVQARPNTADDRRDLYDKVFFEGEEGPRRLSRFFVLMGFATSIAFFGIVSDSTAVVIGAMLVAPLMTPLMGSSLAMIMGWPRRVSITGLVALGGIIFAVGLSILYGWALSQEVSPILNSQVASRIEPTLVDLMIAIAAGGAGAFAMSRPDVSDSLPGVAVAIALVPPLSVVGLMISQNDWTQAVGALLLFITNMVAILLVGAIVFILTGVVPLFQLSKNRSRIRLSIGMAAILAIGVIAVLGVSTNRFQQQAAGTSAVTRAVDSWLDGTTLTPGSISLKNGVAVVEVLGPDEPPPVDDLAAEIETEWGEPLPVRVEWTPQTTYESDAG